MKYLDIANFVVMEAPDLFVRSLTTIMLCVLVITCTVAQVRPDPRSVIPDGISLLDAPVGDQFSHSIRPDIASIPFLEMPLGVFCIWEDQLNARARFPIAVRLHSFEHAERMDGKGSELP